MPAPSFDNNSFEQFSRDLLLSIHAHFNFSRYQYHLSPDVVKDPWTKEEDLAIVTAQSRLGNKWTEM